MQVEHVPPGDAHRLRVRVDLDGCGDGIGAGRLQEPLSFHLHHADAADAGDLQIRVIAEGGDVDADALGRLEDGGPEGHLRVDAVDGDGDGRTDALLLGLDYRARRAGSVGRAASPRISCLSCMCFLLRVASGGTLRQAGLVSTQYLVPEVLDDRAEGDGAALPQAALGGYLRSVGERL